MNGLILRARKAVTRISLIGITRLIKIFSLIVPYHLGVRAGGVLGFAAYYLLHRERTRALSHLTQVFPIQSRSWIHHTARHCFIHLGKCMLEVMLITPRRLEQVIEFRGEENLRDAISIGRGVIYVTGHIGNWELMGHAVAARYNLSVIATPIEPERVNDMIVGLRAGMGVRTILRGRPGASRELVRVFKENRIMGILIDQDTDVESTFVDFMGRPAWTPTAAVSMALKFGAAVVFGSVERRSDNRHVITVEGPLELVQSGHREQDIIANTAMLTMKMEDAIRKNPEQWVWMHRRWRRQPEYLQRT
jgi:Kdo2-lipid IVA lauroyltransferase/acyltransferase